MVHAWLAILRAVDGVPLAEFDLFMGVQFLDLPSHEGIKVRVRVGGHKGSTPVYSCPEGNVVLLQRRSAMKQSHRGARQLAFAIGGK